jgi:hypothetical protein
MLSVVTCQVDGGHVGRCRFVRDFVTVTAARFIGLRSTDENNRIVIGSRLSVDQPLRPARWRPAGKTDGLQFGNRFGKGHNRRDAAERFAAEVLIETGTDDADVIICKRLDDIDNGRVKKLNFINSHDLGVFFEQRINIFCIGRGISKDRRTVMGNDFFFAVAVIKLWFEYLDFLTAEACPADAADKLFRFPGEHAPADDFDPSFFSC